MAKRNEGTWRELRRWEKWWHKAEGGDCRWKDGRALQKGSLGSEGEKGGRRRWRTRTEKLKGGVTTPCRMQNRSSIIVIERRHYRGAQNVVVVVVVIRIFPSVFTSPLCHLFFPLLSPLSSFSLSFFFLFLTTHWNHFETSTDFCDVPRERPSAPFY